MGIFSRYYQPEGPPALRAEKIVIEVRYEVNAEMPSLVSGGQFEMTISYVLQMYLSVEFILVD